jgi:hypothetical protein
MIWDRVEDEISYQRQRVLSELAVAGLIGFLELVVKPFINDDADARLIETVSSVNALAAEGIHVLSAEHDQCPYFYFDPVRQWIIVPDKVPNSPPCHTPYVPRRDRYDNVGKPRKQPNFTKVVILLANKRFVKWLHDESIARDPPSWFTYRTE